MKILVCIPCLYGEVHTLEAIRSVHDRENVELLLIDNGAEHKVVNLIWLYSQKEGVHVIKNPENIYVNPAWNQGIKFFLDRPEYSHIIIMNSDLIMQKDWSEVLLNRWANNPDEICIPIIHEDKNPPDVSTRLQSVTEVHEGTPGVFITMNRKQAEMIFPIPESLKVWFGDQLIYEVLRKFYKTVIPDNLLCYHYWSQNVSKVERISEIIEEDKRQWELIGKNRVKELIEKFS